MSKGLDLTSVRDRVVLVTGGSRGIGRACVELLLEHGAKVAYTYHRPHQDDALREKHAGRVSAHFLDLRDPKSIATCLSEVQRTWGRLDVLVGNAAAGSYTVRHYEPDPTRVDEALFQINASGPFQLCQMALRVMGDNPDDAPRKLINVASVGGLQVFPSMRLADNMSKAAVVYMSQQLAAEHVHSPVDVFVVCPGATDTEMFRGSTLDKLDDAAREAFLRRLPKRRLITPMEVARVILFLASDHSTVMHGAVLDLSMGLGVHPGLLTGGHV